MAPCLLVVWSGRFRSFIRNLEFVTMVAARSADGALAQSACGRLPSRERQCSRTCDCRPRRARAALRGRQRARYRRQPRPQGTSRAPIGYLRARAPRGRALPRVRVRVRVPAGVARRRALPARARARESHGAAAASTTWSHDQGGRARSSSPARQRVARAAVPPRSTATSACSSAFVPGDGRGRAGAPDGRRPRRARDAPLGLPFGEAIANAGHDGASAYPKTYALADRARPFPPSPNTSRRAKPFTRCDVLPSITAGVRPGRVVVSYVDGFAWSPQDEENHAGDDATLRRAFLRRRR